MGGEPRVILELRDVRFGYVAGGPAPPTRGDATGAPPTRGDATGAPPTRGDATGRTRGAAGRSRGLKPAAQRNRDTFDLGPVTLGVGAGECWAIVGPNGAGKSTLLRVMAGLHAPSAGVVTLDGRFLGKLSARDRAKAIAFVPQQPRGGLDFTVRDVVLLGRFPHRSLGLFESGEDYRIANQAMTATQTLDFADRPLATLSGGEAARVHIAAALAQRPRVLLLDEPTASLDLQHQLAIFEILRVRARDEGVAVVVVTHDVNLAGRFCSHVLLLHEGRRVAMGPPGDVLTPAILDPVYEIELMMLELPDARGSRWIVPVGSGRGDAP